MGVLWAVVIMLSWTGHLLYSLERVSLDPASPLLYLHVALQAFLSTGLFITAHDSMHGSVSRKYRGLNRLTGRAAAFLFAAFSYRRLFRFHMLHHRFPGEERDPDFHPGSQNFLRWFFRFFFHYVTVLQILLMAAVFNLLIIPYGEPRVLVFWVLPALLGTLQLFYFGTFLPHRLPHLPEMQPHNARSQKKRFLTGLFSCYFFGYHWEHHQNPRVPWWRMHAMKDEVSGSRT